MSSNERQWLGTFTDNNFCLSVRPRGSERMCSMKTLLHDVGGQLLTQFSEALNYKSLSSPNTNILALIMRNHPYVFRDESMVQQILCLDDSFSRTNAAFAKFGIHDNRCNVEWLINSLFEINEFTILNKILENGPIWIRRKQPESELIVGKPIEFIVKSIQPYNLKWKWENQLLEKFDIVDDKFQIRNIEFVPENKGKYQLMIYSDMPNELFVQDFEVCGQDDWLVPSSDYVRDNSRIALLIGCCDYKKLSNLDAPRKDLPKLDLKLRQIGFETFSFLNVNSLQFEQIIKGFAQKITKDTIFFIYFGGHGKCVKSKDQAILIDEEIVCVNDVMKTIYNPDLKFGMLVFDMCRGSDGNEKESELALPTYEKMHYFATTQPYKIAFEKKESSIVIKPLIDALSTSGCTKTVSELVKVFIENWDANFQYPSFLSFKSDVILGKSLSIPESRITSISMENENENILYAEFRHQTYNNLYIIIKEYGYKITLPNKDPLEWRDELSIDLFQYFEKRNDKSFIELKCRNRCDNIFDVAIDVPDELQCFFCNSETKKQRNHPIK